MSRELKELFIAIFVLLGKDNTTSDYFQKQIIFKDAEVEGQVPV